VREHQTHFTGLQAPPGSPYRLYRLRRLTSIGFTAYFYRLPLPYGLPASLMETLPLNRLRCSNCKSFRSIQSFPLRDGYRLYTCESCRKRQRDRYLEAKGIFIQERHDRRVLRAKRAKLRAQRRGIWEPADLEKAWVEAEAQRQAWDEWREFQAQLQDDEWQWDKEERQWEIEQERQWEEDDPVRAYG